MQKGAEDCFSGWCNKGFSLISLLIKNILALALSISPFVCIAYAIILWHKQDTLWLIPLVMIPVGPLFLAIHLSTCCSTWSYLGQFKDKVTLSEYINQMVTVAPVISLSVYCYHLESLTRTVTRTDAQGRSYTDTETYSETVVTYSESENFEFSSWFDASDIPKIDKSLNGRVS